eukprot:6123180-Prymnesium_polylepis.1
MSPCPCASASASACTCDWAWVRDAKRLRRGVAALERAARERASARACKRACGAAHGGGVPSVERIEGRGAKVGVSLDGEGVDALGLAMEVGAVPDARLEVGGLAVAHRVPIGLAAP